MENIFKKHQSDNYKYKRPPLRDFVPGEPLQFINTCIENHGEYIYIYGITEQGNTVCVRFDDFRPYFYAFKTSDITKEELENIIGNNLVLEEGHSSFILNMDTTQRTPIMGYHPDGSVDVYRITMGSPKYISTCRKIFESRNIPTYEGNILYYMRFMIDKRFGGFDWLSISKYSIPSERKTNCQIEAEASHHYLQKIKKDNASEKHVRILFFDLEILKKGAGYAGPEVDPIIIISCVLCNIEYEVLDERIFFFVPPGGNVPYSKVNVEIFEREEDMLLQWTNYVLNADPDLFSGYNIDGYDWNYLFERSKALKIYREFSNFGRHLEKKCGIHASFFQSAATGARKDYETIVPGRFTNDMLKFVKSPGNRIKLRSYTLGNVLFNLLGKNKVEMPYDQIPIYYYGTDKQRAHLGHYAWYDSEACRELMINRMTMINYIEKSKVCGVPMSSIVSKGMEDLSLSILARYAQDELVVLPSIGEQENDEQTDGATVLDPIFGLHNDWVITLDLQSLYPSIICNENISYDTIAPLVWLQKHLKPDQYNVPPIKGCDFGFVCEDIRIGLANKIETDLFNWRLRVKAEMKNEKDPHKKAILDALQNSIKLLMNSFYGFFKGRKMPDKRLMASVTAWGREILEKMKELVEKTFSNAKVIYGDTDSIFVKFFNVDKEEAFKLGQQAADLCTEMLNEKRKALGKKYIHKLQREKGFFPFLLIGKKKYAGRKWMTPEQIEPEFACSGLENVRRDNALIGSETQEEVLKMIIMDGDFDGKRAIKYVHEQINLLLNGKIEMSKLIITKNLSKTFEQYEQKNSKQPHVTLSKKINLRKDKTGEVGYNVGDRVKYVIVQGPKNKQKSTDVAECAEDPLFALQHRLGIDFDYYLWQQMMKPLLRVCTPIFSPKVKQKTINGIWEDKPTEDMKKLNSKGERVDKTLLEMQKLRAFKLLFVGNHMNARIQKSNTGNSNALGITKFTIKKLTCLNCGVSSEKSICNACEPQRNLVLLKLENEMGNLQKKRWGCWVGCQQCVGEKHTENIQCGQKDCNNFYERQKVVIDIEDLNKKLERF